MKRKRRKKRKILIWEIQTGNLMTMQKSWRAQTLIFINEL